MPAQTKIQSEAPQLPGLTLENSYAALPPVFHAMIAANPVSEPKLVRLNEALARDIGLDLSRLDHQMAAQVFSGSSLPKDSKYLAMAYAGHQFGNFVPQLGDGRAALLGEVKDASGRKLDIHLKGSGRTPYSRGGDGRAAIGPVVREYVISEAMHALGIPTTRSLAITTTGEPVYREEPLHGAVLARLASSHIRVGTFQYFAAKGDNNALKVLADYAIARHYPELTGSAEPYLAFLESVIDRQATLIAKWMHVGFIHGVMNTDNMTVSGETIDYGPCAFMDHYNHDQVYSSIDRHGRYAFSAQAGIAQWNLARLAETLVPLLDANEDKAIEKATEAVNGFSQIFIAHWKTGMARKIGLASMDDNENMARRLLSLMQKHHTDFTNTFRRLSTAMLKDSAAAELAADFNNDPDFFAWLDQWKKGLGPASGWKKISDAMLAVNPLYIPRNHLVEEVIVAAETAANFGPMDKLLDAVSRPFEPQPGLERYTKPPLPEERVLQTFCGT
jgi:uncharacterized protein YdiU (UPF0061 family)